MGTSKPLLKREKQKKRMKNETARMRELLKVSRQKLILYLRRFGRNKRV